MQPVARDISNKVSKEEACYRHLESCGTCGFFKTDKCDLVDGTISSECVCNKYNIREKLPAMKHAEFYQDEYKKVNP